MGLAGEEGLGGGRRAGLDSPVSSWQVMLDFKVFASGSISILPIMNILAKKSLLVSSPSS